MINSISRTCGMNDITLSHKLNNKILDCLQENNGGVCAFPVYLLTVVLFIIF